jgi:hypothetical protein
MKFPLNPVDVAQIKPSGYDKTDAFCENELIQYKEKKNLKAHPNLLQLVKLK